MQVQRVSNQNSILKFQGKGNLKKLTDPMIKATKTQDSVILTNKSNGIKLEIQTFPEKEIKKLQDIADKIYKRKRYERSFFSIK